MIDERSRFALHARLGDVLGPQEAATLMEHLPPVGWADVATRRDLDHLERVLRADIATLAAELRGEMATTAAALRADMAGLRADVAEQLATTTRTLLLAMVGAVTSATALAFAAARFGVGP